MYPLFFLDRGYLLQGPLYLRQSHEMGLIIFFRRRTEAMRVRVGRSSQTASVALRERRPQGCVVGEVRKGPQQLGEGAQRVETALSSEVGVTTINASLVEDDLAVRLDNSIDASGQLQGDIDG
jgi:hypothetical protein